MLKLAVQQNRIGPIRGRHPWVFSGALKSIPEGLSSGTPIHLVDEAGIFLAQGYFNSYSQIAVRLWSWDESEEVNKEFFLRRIEQAYDLRKQFVANKNTDAYRIVNGESDLLPGLIVDKYAGYLSVQFHTVGIERWKKEITEALVKIIKPKGIYERSDVGARTRQFVIASEAKQSLESRNQPGTESNGIAASADTNRPPRNDRGRTGLLNGEVPEKIKITENGHKFWVDIIGGQKTGFFLDQRDKRQALAKYVEGKKVLNCFSYTGGFSVYALGAGAEKVVSVDASESALMLAEENVKLNKLDEKKCEFILADVKEYLGDLASETSPQSSPLPRRGRASSLASAEERARERSGFDVIILDPPAFIKDRRKIHEGVQGYKKINELALKILPANGILVTCSCSAYLSLQDFRFMLTEAASRAGRTLQILETYTHGLDHPELVAYTEGDYLKCIFARVL